MSDLDSKKEEFFNQYINNKFGDKKDLYLSDIGKIRAGFEIGIRFIQETYNISKK